MSNLVTIEQPMMSADQVRDRVNGIQKVMGAVMKPDTHYGVIPGTKTNTLYKAGSEVLLTTFGIGVRLVVQDLSDGDNIRYQVKAIGFHTPTGNEVGEGIGECSTGEEKYKWRTAICDEEFDATPESKKRIKFSKKWSKFSNGYEVYQTKQVRTEPADLANTVLKMAKKRAQIDLTLTALGASDIFTQDIEDLPDELRDVAVDHEQSRQQGTPIEHPDMKAATTIQELSKVMGKLTQEERKKYVSYFNVRKLELESV